MVNRMGMDRWHMHGTTAAQFCNFVVHCTADQQHRSIVTDRLENNFLVQADVHAEMLQCGRSHNASPYVQHICRHCQWQSAAASCPPDPPKHPPRWAPSCPPPRHPVARTNGGTAAMQQPAVFCGGILRPDGGHAAGRWTVEARPAHRDESPAA